MKMVAASIGAFAAVFLLTLPAWSLDSLPLAPALHGMPAPLSLQEILTPASEFEQFQHTLDRQKRTQKSEFDFLVTQLEAQTAIHRSA